MTKVSIEGNKWIVDGIPTYSDIKYRGNSIEGLLLNARMVNAIFDDGNPYTRDIWNYPDTGEWDADRNTNEFVAMLPEYREHGLAAITVNLQGGAPSGYYRLNQFREFMHQKGISGSDSEIWKGLPSPESQPWDSSGFTPDGSLKIEYTHRLNRILEKTNQLSMVVILGLFYFGQDERLQDEKAIKSAVRNACEWVLSNGYENVVIEINNECSVPKYEHEILQPHRVHELIKLAKSVSINSRSLLAGTSYGGNTIPGNNVTKSSDFILMHGNGVTEPSRISEMIKETRELSDWVDMPILFNEDDHFEFDKEKNNFNCAINSYAGWGYFDPGAGAGGNAAFGDYENGYQLIPVNWSINTNRKKDYFRYLDAITSGNLSA
ncbi:MAG: hypothetical protein VX981_04015 [Chloroflexota bacterium]|nr:hypothetical protein [Chloroflexota bacterium]